MNHTDYVGRTLIAMDNPLTSSELYGSPDMAAKTIYAHAGELEQIMEYITFLDNPGNIDNLIALLGAVESPDIVLIDYLQIIPASNDTRKAIREVQVGDISRKIKLAALQMNCPFVVAAQLSRAGDGEKPKLSHLRESGTLEQDADTVTFLYQQEDGGKVASTQKNRRGGFGEHDVRWNGEFMRFDRYHTSF
jgi:replicative DNA helicase